jgi:anaerobic selenocysteine-containing dehydrogenase
MFIEMSKELAKEKGIQNGDRVKIRSARGEIQAVALVTGRFKPFQVEGKTVHQIGMPWHYGGRASLAETSPMTDPACRRQQRPFRNTGISCGCERRRHGRMTMIRKAMLVERIGYAACRPGCQVACK